jgi:hypothetical protein
MRLGKVVASSMRTPLIKKLELASESKLEGKLIALVLFYICSCFLTR